MDSVAQTVGNLFNKELMAELARDVMALFGQLDILVDQVRINFAQPIRSMVVAGGDRIFQLNFFAPMGTPHQEKRTRMEWIVQVSSIFEEVRRAERNAYSASKAGWLGMTRSMG